MREALALASRLEYDVVFCDISMPELTGIDAARELASWPTSPLVVFVTAHQDYAVQAYSVDGFDYLLKPVSEERLGPHDRPAAGRAARPARAQRRARRSSKVPVAARGSPVLLDPEDVFWAEANGDASRIATYDELLQSGQSMRELEDILPSARFFRIHRRHLVNLQQVVRLELADSGRWVVQLSDRDGTVLEVARRQTRALKQHLGLR